MWNRNTLHARLRASLKRARIDAGLTQAALAGRLSKPQSFVSKFEKGQRELNVIEFWDVTIAIGINPLEVLTSAGMLQGHCRKQSSSQRRPSTYRASSGPTPTCTSSYGHRVPRT